MTVYAAPESQASVVSFKSRYENFIGGEWTPPAKGQYFENPTPVTGQAFTEVARGTAPRAWSTSSTASASRRGSRWPPVRASRRSPSPGRPPPGA